MLSNALHQTEALVGGYYLSKVKTILVIRILVSLGYVNSGKFEFSGCDFVLIIRIYVVILS